MSLLRSGAIMSYLHIFVKFGDNEMVGRVHGDTIKNINDPQIVFIFV